MKLNRDQSYQFKQASRMAEETIARKTKELQSVLKEKKCNGCVLCLEDLGNNKGMATDQLVSNLNERLVGKTVKIGALEE